MTDATKMQETVVQMLNYSQGVLAGYRKELLSANDEIRQFSHAVNGIVIMLVTHLIKTSNKIISESLNNQTSNVKTDLLDIRKQFNNFIDDIITKQENAK